MIDLRKRKGRSYMKKKIYVCAPFGENLQEELQNAKTYYDYVLKSDCVPVGPHAYAVMLGCENAQEKKQMRRAGMSLLWFCDEVWVFGEAQTENMQEELSFCKNMKLKTKRIKEKEIKKQEK